MTREEVLTQACNQCMEELYKYAVPHIEFDDFKKECKEYSEKYKEWDDWKMKNIPHPEWEGKSIEECIGLRPYEFYYLPKEIMKDIRDSYIYAYNLDHNQDLLDTIKIHKNYCKDPIVDKYIEGELREDGTRRPGHRGYEHPNNVEKELRIILEQVDPSFVEISEQLQNKFFEFLDMAGNFFKWNGDLDSFNTTINLGASPCNNKERVIENWKKFRNKDILINENQIKIDYYGEDNI
jgi:hypothetical protein